MELSNELKHINYDIDNMPKSICLDCVVAAKTTWYCCLTNQINPECRLRVESVVCEIRSITQTPLSISKIVTTYYRMNL